MVIFGIGNMSKIIAISISVFFPMLINTMAGVRQISPLYLEAAENYGASFLRLFSRVVLPGSLPLILSGLRIALNASLGITIASEIAAGNDGLGNQIWLAWEVLDTEKLYACLIVIAVIGVAFAKFVQFLQRRLVPWQAERRPARR
jgi:NitT/TauT family transport system permease protein